MTSPSRWPVHPLLFAAYAVLFVYAANIAEVVPDQVIWPLTVALLAAGGVLLLASLLLRSPRRGAIVASAVVVVAAFTGHAVGLLDEVTEEPVPDWVILLGGLVLIGVALVYAILAKRSLGTVTAALNAFAVVLVLITLLTIVPNEASRPVQASEGEPISGSSLSPATRRPDRDIYFIVLDRYGSEWSLENAFGVTTDLPEDLAERGFQVIPGARANYHASDFSIATMLNLDYVTNLVAVHSPSTDRTPVRRLVARHEVGRFLRANGYRYYHLGAWWEPTRGSPIADEVLALGKTTELESVLREATILPTLQHFLDIEGGDTHSRDQHRDDALFEFRQVERLAKTAGRKFVFAHILMPHPPYVIAEGGRVVYAAEAKAKPEAELLQDQVDFTNERVRAMVDALLAGPDESDPIIVIAADEGPYLCYELDCVDGSDRDYGIRLGVLRAYYLPGLDYEVPSDDSGVNVFRMLLREYFGLDLPDLPNRSYSWVDPGHDLYTLRDVTDSLPLPGS